MMQTCSSIALILGFGFLGIGAIALVLCVLALWIDLWLKRMKLFDLFLDFIWHRKEFKQWLDERREKQEKRLREFEERMANWKPDEQAQS